jgi:hypothetical protein
MLFKESLNTKAAEIKQYISVNASIAYKSISPYIESAERDFIKPLLGSDQYQELLSYYDDPSSWDPGEGSASAGNLALLLKMVQRPLINIAYWRGFPMLSVNLGDSGAFRTEREGQKPLFQYQEENLKNSFKQDGFNSLDNLLEFLEEKINDFPKFKDSDNYTVFKSKFIRTAPEFNLIYNIGSSRLVFLRLQPFIDQVNDFEIIPALGRSFFDEIKAIMVSGADLLDLQKQLIDLIKKVQAFMSVSRGITELGINITDKGLFFDTTQSTGTNIRNQSVIPDNHLDMLRRNADNTGKAYMQYLLDFLHTNILDFPTYAEFSGYNQGENLNPLHRDNRNKKTAWM